MTSISGNPSVAQRIARVLPTLTRSHREMANYVLTHPLQVATMPIDEMAHALGMSVATVNRFARALEFDGYSQFRAALVLGFESTLAPVEKLRSKLEQSSTAAAVFATALTDTQRNIELTRRSLDLESCDKAVSRILAARRIYILGFGASSWLGGLLQRSLSNYCDDVHMLASIESSSYAARTLVHLKPTDLLIAIAFPRYFADTIDLAQRVRDRGVPVLGLTDRVTSPLAPLASTCLYAHTDSQYFANSEASALAMIEALTCAVSHSAKESLKAATELAQSVLPWLHENQLSQPRSISAAKKSVSTSPTASSTKRKSP